MIAKLHGDQLRVCFVCGWSAWTEAIQMEAKWMDGGKLQQMRMRMPYFYLFIYSEFIAC